jgi:hypothetical protein
MAYIGVQPTDTYLSIASQQITGTGSATYTLDYSVSTEEDVAVFVNNVRQNVSSYTVSGDQLTLGGTISASDECWVLFLGRTVGTKTPAVGSVTNDMLAGSIANAKLANSSINLNGSAVSLGGSASVTNTPAFLVNLSGDQSIASGVFTKITFDSEVYDTDSAFASNKFTVPSDKAGKYVLTAGIYFDNIDDAEYAELYFFKNGSSANFGRSVVYAPATNRHIAFTSTITLSLSVSDYIEIYVYQNEGLSQSARSAYTFFAGHKLIGV